MNLHFPDEDDTITNATLVDVLCAIEMLDHRDVNPYVILADDADSNHYMQTIKRSPQRFCVEYRECAEGPHWASWPLQIEDVKTAFACFLAGDELYRKAIEWRDITRVVDDGAPSDGAIDEHLESRRQQLGAEFVMLAGGIAMLLEGAMERVVRRALLDFADDVQLRALNRLYYILGRSAETMHEVANAIALNKTPPRVMKGDEVPWILPEIYEPVSVPKKPKRRKKRKIVQGSGKKKK